jgi:hypothetical protein
VKNTVVLTETQRGILQIALEIARDKFQDHVKVLLTEWHDDRLIAKFEEQAADAEKLLTLVSLAENITITEEIE